MLFCQPSLPEATVRRHGCTSNMKSVLTCMEVATSYEPGPYHVVPPWLVHCDRPTMEIPPGLSRHGWTPPVGPPWEGLQRCASTVGLLWNCSTAGPPGWNYYGCTTTGGSTKAMPICLGQLSRSWNLGQPLWGSVELPLVGHHVWATHVVLTWTCLHRLCPLVWTVGVGPPRRYLQGLCSIP